MTERVHAAKTDEEKWISKGCCLRARPSSRLGQREHAFGACANLRILLFGVLFLCLIGAVVQSAAVNAEGKGQEWANGSSASELPDLVQRSNYPRSEIAGGFALSNPTEDNKIYLLGGNASTTEFAPTTVIQCYDASRDSWTVLPIALPYPYLNNESFGAAVASNGKIYLSPGNGYGGWGGHNRIIEVDPVAGTARERAAISAGNIWGVALVPAPASLGGVYLFGGWDGGAVSSVLHYDPSTDTVRAVGSLSGGRTMGARVQMPDGSVYLFGGNTLATASLVEVFDPRNETLTVIPNPKGFSFNHGTKGWVGSDGCIYLWTWDFSGNGPNTVVKFDPVTKEFSDFGLPPGPFPGNQFMWGCTPDSVWTKVFFFCRYSPSTPDVRYNETWELTFLKNMPDLTPKADYPRAEIKSGFAVSNPTAENKIYLLGGNASTTEYAPTTVIQCYDALNDYWTVLPIALPYPYLNNESFGAAVASNGKVYLDPGNGPGGWGQHNRIIEVDPVAGTARERAAISSGNIWGVALVPAPAFRGGVYLFGGWNGGPVSEVLHYDPSSDMVRPVGSLGGGRTIGARVQTPDGAVYLFGGSTTETAVIVEKFDPVTETLTEIPNPGEFRFNHGTKGWMGADGKIYLWNWAHFGNGHTGVVRFDPNTGEFDAYGVPPGPNPANYFWGCCPDLSGISVYFFCRFSASDPNGRFGETWELSLSDEPAIPAEERAALIDLYNATNGDTWADNTGWRTPPLAGDGFAQAGTEGSWRGVAVKNGHVSQISLTFNKLAGFLPPTLANLSLLDRLYLFDNQLEGAIPPEWGVLAELRELNLGGNRLGGSLPETLSNLANLEVLDVKDNQLSGSIPAAWGNLSQLRELNLARNQLSGTIPAELGRLTELVYLQLNNNQFVGEIPAEIGNLHALNFLNLGANALVGEVPSTLANLHDLIFHASLTNCDYNGLFVSDPAVKTFLDGKMGPEWSNMQTVAPKGVQAVATGAGATKLGWTPSPRLAVRKSAEQEEADGYEVWGTGGGEGTWRLLSTLHGQGVDAVTEALSHSRTNKFKVRSVTAPHDRNANRVYSSFSPEILVRPTSATGNVDVYVDGEHAGAILPDSPSQVLPASAVTLRLAPSSFANASAENPVCIVVKLPGRALLSQTLASGTMLTAAPQSDNGESLVDLAVAEYRLTNGKPVPVDGSSLQGIGPHAVQVLRYVEGEDAFWLRVTESTASWAPLNGGDFLGVTIGLGGGFWPSTAATNWGAEGIGKQVSTLLCGNLKEYVFDAGAGNFFSLTLLCQDQRTGLPGATTFGPDPVFPVFTREEAVRGTSSTAALGGVLADTASADVNLDGVEDLVAVVSGEPRVYWCPGLLAGGYGGMNVTALDSSAGRPAVVDAADVDGDALPDLIVGEQGGTLSVYPWSRIFGATRNKTAVQASLQRKLSIASVPTASLALDLNGDGKKDWAGVSTTGNSLEVRFGEAFLSAATYSTPAEPVGLVSGDFNGDGAPDLAMACKNTGSVAVYWNNGLGSFTRGDVNGLGNGPSALDAGDLNRDGYDDLVVTIKNSKELVALLSTGGNTFDWEGRQRVALPHKPRAVALADLDGKLGPDATIGFEDSSRLTRLYADPLGHLGDERTVTDMVGAILTDLEGVSLDAGVTSLRPVSGGRTTGGIYDEHGLVQTLAAESGTICWPRSAGVSFALVNLGLEDASATFDLHADRAKGPVATTTLPLEARRQAFGYLYYDDVLGPEASQDNHWAKARMDVADVKGFFMEPAPGGPDLDGVEVPTQGGGLTAMAFPEVLTGEGYTKIVLINPGFEQASVRLSLYKADGSLKAQAGRLIPPGDRLETDVVTLFPAAASGDWVGVRSDRELLGTESFGTHSGNVAVLSALPAGRSSGILFDPHMASGDFGTVVYFSDLTLVNTGGTAARIQVTRRNDDGVILNTATVDVPAMGKIRTEVKTLLGLAGTVEGWLQVDPGGASGITGCMTFGEQGAHSKILSSLPLQGLGHRKFLLPFIANGKFGESTYFTGFAVLDPDSATRPRVKLTAYDSAGQALASRTYTLKKPDNMCADCHKRQVFMLNQAMAELPNMLGGYLVLEAETMTRGLLVFQLFGDFNNTVLSAVPSIPLD